MYSRVTRNIQVTVEPQYLEEESTPSENHYFWAYTIEIENLGEETVQLRSRCWEITDAHGRISNVRGSGVVGEEPTLSPGASFEYTSGCPLTTPSGIMAGNYQMQTKDGEFFTVMVPTFSLDIPDLLRVIN
ncbi:MAG: Co2+/Mg2+ efflux protein ApaG [Stappiaceae bacterium]